jgi:hypothetical protein
MRQARIRSRCSSCCCSNAHKPEKQQSGCWCLCHKHSTHTDTANNSPQTTKHTSFDSRACRLAASAARRARSSSAASSCSNALQQHMCKQLTLCMLKLLQMSLKLLHQLHMLCPHPLSCLLLLQRPAGTRTMALLQGQCHCCHN